MMLRGASLSNTSFKFFPVEPTAIIFIEQICDIIIPSCSRRKINRKKMYKHEEEKYTNINKKNVQISSRKLYKYQEENCTVKYYGKILRQNITAKYYGKILQIYAAGRLCNCHFQIDIDIYIYLYIYIYVCNIICGRTELNKSHCFMPINTHTHTHTYLHIYCHIYTMRDIPSQDERDLKRVIIHCAIALN